MCDDGETDNFKSASDAMTGVEGGWNDRNEGRSLSVRVSRRCACGIEAPKRSWDLYEHPRITLTSDSS